MIHGPDIDGMVSRAKDIVRDALVSKAESDGTPATLRAMYVLKAQQAAVVVAGGTSLNEGIEREAELRGVTPVQLAETILQMASQSVELELMRMQLNVKIEQANCEQEIVNILNGLGAAFVE